MISFLRKVFNEVAKTKKYVMILSKTNTLPMSERIEPKNALNAAYRKLKPTKSELEQFTTNLSKLLDKVRHSEAEKESEENFKNLLSEFLKDTSTNCSLRSTCSNNRLPTTATRSTESFITNCCILSGSPK